MAFSPTLGAPAVCCISLSPDSVALDLTNPQCLNKYSYVFNNPLKYNDPTGNWPNWGKLWGGVKKAFQATVNFVKKNVDVIQTALDVVGCIPVIGAVADVANGVISACRGDWVGMGLSLASAVPVVGDILGAGRVGVKIVDKAADLVRGVDRAGDVARIVDKAGDASRAGDILGTGAKRIHGNSLLTTRKTFGYALVDKKTNAVLKYGETIHPKTRYSQTYLNNINADMNILAEGTKREMHYWQRDQILDYWYYYGRYPTMNLNGW